MAIPVVYTINKFTLKMFDNHLLISSNQKRKTVRPETKKEPDQLFDTGSFFDNRGDKNVLRHGHTTIDDQFGTSHKLTVIRC